MPITLVPGDNILNFQLTPVPPVGDLYGVVRDLNTGAVLAGAQVVLSGLRAEIRTSDANGNYVFSGLPLGNYQVTGNMSGYEEWVSPTISLQAGDNPLDIDLAPLPPALASFSGIITNGVTGTPVAGAEVTVWQVVGSVNVFVQTDANGLFSFGGLPVGDYHFRVDAAGYETYLLM